MAKRAGRIASAFYAFGFFVALCAGLSGVAALVAFVLF